MGVASCMSPDAGERTWSSKLMRSEDVARFHAYSHLLAVVFNGLLDRIPDNVDVVGW